MITEILEYAKWLGMDTENEQVRKQTKDFGQHQNEYCAHSVQHHCYAAAGAAVDRTGWPEGASPRRVETMVSYASRTVQWPFVAVNITENPRVPAAAKPPPKRSTTSTSLLERASGTTRATSTSGQDMLIL